MNTASGNNKNNETEVLNLEAVEDWRILGCYAVLIGK
jgi:hypothetical protein